MDQVLLKDCKIKVKLTDLISDKIKFLCKEIPKEEWSGVLFYSVKGTIADPRNIVITLENLFPMNKGTGAFTEYAYNEELVEFRMTNPETNYFKIGHIHSHNTMGVFFSGTDTSELSDNVKFHNYYLSVIVNNYFDIEARVAFLGTEEVSSISGKDENGDPYYITTGRKRLQLFYYSCDIEKESSFINVGIDFINRVKYIITEALKPKNPISTGYPESVKYPIGKQSWSESQSWTNPKQPSLWEDWEKSNGWNTDTSLISPKSFDTDAIHPTKVLSQQDEIDMTEEELEYNMLLEEFLMDFLVAYPDFAKELTNTSDIYDLDDVFIFLESTLRRKTTNDYFEWITDNLYLKFTDMFENQSYIFKESEFPNYIESMIEIIEEYRVEHRIANKLVIELIKLKLIIETQTI